MKLNEYATIERPRYPPSTNFQRLQDMSPCKIVFSYFLFSLCIFRNLRACSLTKHHRTVLGVYECGATGDSQTISQSLSVIKNIANQSSEHYRAVCHLFFSLQGQVAIKANWLKLRMFTLFGLVHEMCNQLYQLVYDHFYKI